MHNRKQRRASAASQRRKGDGNSDTVILTAPQQRRIAQAYNNCLVVERHLATLDLERDAAINQVRQRRAELHQECANALRGQGVDVDDPSIRWNVNPETMEVERHPMHSAAADGAKIDNQEKS